MTAFERPQKGNPHQLTVKQHVHTAHCIRQFAGPDGRVEVRQSNPQRMFRKGPKSRIFYTERTWDERVENSFMKAIEDAFHVEVDAAVKGQPAAPRNNEAISRYHLLWCLRWQFHKRPQSDVTLVGVAGDRLTKDQEENAETKKAAFVRAGGVVPARFVNSFKIQQLHDMNMGEYDGVTWGLLRAERGEFVVADCYGAKCILPVAPTLCFCGGLADGVLVHDDVEKLNRTSVEMATDFYFARDLARCPGVT